ncbi:TIGR00730 family Rossman fold protein [Corynebacterium auris]|uniref:TIGR00730 family Rossman fold protein n=1 Tax=Corynebacterium auris TaxID=44750 RepID=UPI0025B5787F|nr:TIGR00730 family Rossman fold protein [Corynebacterium auris]WJY69032.1 LOG family protein YvdD [Corynebacterium auris]
MGERNVAAAVLRDPAGAVLCVRRAPSPLFELPAEAIEPGETPLRAALRAAKRGTGLRLDPRELTPLGAFTARAPGHPGHAVRASVYEHTGPAADPAAPSSTCGAELAWIHPARPGAHELAPLARAVFPALVPRRLRAVAVYAGANPGTNPENLELASRFGAALARRGVTLVYGGSRLGVMGRVALSAMEAGGESIGVLTRHLASYELRFEGLTRLELVDTMARRKERMSELSDAVVALPGGTGTLDELFAEWAGQQLGLHRTPIGLLGARFWAPFVALVDHMVAEGFIRREDRESLVLADDPDELLDALCAWVAPPPRWG